MGQVPAKMFPRPTPYGQQSDTNVLMQAQAPTPAPQNNLLPLNPSAPVPDPTQQAQPNQLQSAMQQYFGGNYQGRNYRPQF